MFAPGATPRPPTKPGAQIAEDVAVQVAHHQHVVVLRLLNQLHAHVVHEPFDVVDAGRTGDFARQRRIDLHAIGQLRIFKLGSEGGRDRAAGVVPQAVSELHDVRFADRRHRLAAVLHGIVERIAADVSAALDRHRLDADARRLQTGADLLARRDGVDELNQLRRFRLTGLELDAGVQVFGVLTDDNQIDFRLLKVRPHALVRLAGPDAGVEPEFLPQRDVDRTESLANRRRDRSLQRDPVGSDRLEDRLGNLALSLDDFDAAFLHVPVDFDSGGIDALASRLGEFRTSSISRDQRDVVHASLDLISDVFKGG